MSFRRFSVLTSIPFPCRHADQPTSTLEVVREDVALGKILVLKIVIFPPAALCVTRTYSQLVVTTTLRR